MNGRGLAALAGLLALSTGATAGEKKRFELRGSIRPEASAAVHLYGATTPFSLPGTADARGRFRFRGLEAGTYTLSVLLPAQGEMRRTFEIGPSTADGKGRVHIVVEIEESKLEREPALRGRAIVSKRQLSIPEKAWGSYGDAQKHLSRREVDAAIEDLKRAVEIAPQFANAWNTLGTIAYQTHRFDDAERYFRTALEQDPTAFEPLVNLGGVLLTLGKLDEALQYNLQSVLARPNDALANSQLGMSYFAVGRLDLGQKYLEIAKRLDPAHFSHPQLTLAEIHLRRKEYRAAADELEDFVRRHPDWPKAEQVRDTINKLRQ